MPSGWGKRLATAPSVECFRKKSTLSVRLCELAACRHLKPILDPDCFTFQFETKARAATKPAETRAFQITDDITESAPRRAE
jgi:hypothetical protein